MSNWAYVAIAYTIVWGALAGYALVLARRVTQAAKIAHSLEEPSAGTTPPGGQDNTLCETPPVP